LYVDGNTSEEATRTGELPPAHPARESAILPGCTAQAVKAKEHNKPYLFALMDLPGHHLVNSR
jgi:hypothetical protein